MLNQLMFYKNLYLKHFVKKNINKVQIYDLLMILKHFKYNNKNFEKNKKKKISM